MKKIGILTYHYADNFGAILQAYALQKAFNSFDECEAELINYIPGNYRYECRWDNNLEKILFKKKRQLFDDFLSKHCCLSNRCNYIVDGEYDTYCVGSDQVWNTTYLDKNYLLQSVSDGTDKVSFSTSIALKNDSVYLDNQVFKEFLQGFRKISVRESENAKLLSQLLNRECERQCDPTLLLDIDDYKAIEEPVEMKRKYILFFWLLNDDDVYRGVEYVNHLSRKLGLPILHSLYGSYCQFVDNSLGTMFYSSPGNFLYYINNAEYVVTNSYHATLFSLRYKKNINLFIVDSMKARFETLFEIYDIEESVVNQISNFYEISTVNHTEIMNAMKSEKERGYKYLSEILEG